MARVGLRLGPWLGLWLGLWLGPWLGPWIGPWIGPWLGPWLRSTFILPEAARVHHFPLLVLFYQPHWKENHFNEDGIVNGNQTLCQWH